MLAAAAYKRMWQGIRVEMNYPTDVAESRTWFFLMYRYPTSDRSEEQHRVGWQAAFTNTASPNSFEIRICEINEYEDEGATVLDQEYMVEDAIMWE